MNKLRGILGLGFLFMGGLVGATDFGAVLTNKFNAEDKSVDVNGLGVDLVEVVKLAPWLGIDITPTIGFDLRGYYQFAFETQKDASKKIQHQYDLEQLSFSFDAPQAFGPKTSLSVVAGRSLFYDFSAKVLAHKLDGVLASAKGPKLGVRAGVGYTGLLFKRTTTILISAKDKSESADDTKLLAPSRLIGLAELSLPDLFLGQNFTLSALGQFDLRANTAKVGDSVSVQQSNGSAVNTYYAGLGLDGKITSGFYYKVAAFGELGQTQANANGAVKADTILAGMVDLSFNVFAPDFVASRFSFGGNLSTGDDADHANSTSAEGNIKGGNHFFLPISKRGGGYIFIPQYGNSLEFFASWSLKPVSNRPGDPDLGLTLAGFGFMRILNGPIDSDKTLKSGTDQSYLGTEVDLSADLRLTSDLVISINSGLFLPNLKALSLDRAGWKIGFDVNLGL